MSMHFSPPRMTEADFWDNHVPKKNSNEGRVVLSLYDFTGVACRPWAELGYTCICFDIQHLEEPVIERFSSGGLIIYRKEDLHVRENLSAICKEFMASAVFLMAFPVCTDMAVSGAKHFSNKKAISPLVQEIAADHAIWAEKVAACLGVPYMIENPVSVLSTIWRKPDHTFHPWEYGGYLTEAEYAHPQWPEYIVARDSYPKKTCLWVGGGFVMPPKEPVPHAPVGYSVQYAKLGGKSQKTKNIRSAGPRGFLKAVCVHNAPLLKDA